MIHSCPCAFFVVGYGVGPECCGHFGMVIGFSQQLVCLVAVVIGNPLMLNSGPGAGHQRGELLERELLGSKRGNG